MYAAYELSGAVSRQFDRASGFAPKAAQLFDRVYRDPHARFFRHAPEPLKTLENISGEIESRSYNGTQSVALNAIHGTVNRANDFDDDFHPLQYESKSRWQSVATAMLRGIDLPPVELIKVGDEYFVKDGHHRISVAKALGYRYIDAAVEEWTIRK